MANTVDILGEQETLDGLVSHTLEDFEDNRIREVKARTFAKHENIKTVNLPNLVNVGERMFLDCHNLESVEIPKAPRYASYTFGNCYKLRDVNNSIADRLFSYTFSNCFSLNSLNLSNVTTLDGYCFSETGLGSIVLPNCKKTDYNIGSGVRTSTIDISQKITVGSYCFRNAYSLVHLILRGDSVCSFTSSNAFNNTPIRNGLGWIYVPTDLVDSYKTATNWSTYANQIVSIDEYPKALTGETITDTWDEIFQAEDNNTYKTRYSVGDTKYLIIGGTYVLMQIIAFDRDILSSDGESTAKITWLSKGLSFKYPINFTSSIVGGWRDCECRKFLNNTIYEQIPESVRNKILAVNKTCRISMIGNDTVIVSDKLWIPSAKEIYDEGETSGFTYTDFFSDDSLKKKSLGLTEENFDLWLLRSVYASNSFRAVTLTGIKGSDAVADDNYIALGFCT